MTEFNPHDELVILAEEEEDFDEDEDFGGDEDADELSSVDDFMLSSAEYKSPAPITTTEPDDLDDFARMMLGRHVQHVQVPPVTAPPPTIHTTTSQSQPTTPQLSLEDLLPMKRVSQESTQLLFPRQSSTEFATKRTKQLQIQALVASGKFQPESLPVLSEAPVSIETVPSVSGGLRLRADMGANIVRAQPKISSPNLQLLSPVQGRLPDTTLVTDISKTNTKTTLKDPKASKELKEPKAKASKRGSKRKDKENEDDASPPQVEEGVTGKWRYIRGRRTYVLSDKRKLTGAAAFAMYKVLQQRGADESSAQHDNDADGTSTTTTTTTTTSTRRKRSRSGKHTRAPRRPRARKRKEKETIETGSLKQLKLVFTSSTTK